MELEENNESERKAHDHEELRDSNDLKIILPVSLFFGSVCCVIMGICFSYKFDNNSDQYMNFDESV